MVQAASMAITMPTMPPADSEEDDESDTGAAAPLSEDEEEEEEEEKEMVGGRSCELELSSCSTLDVGVVVTAGR